MSSPLRRLGQTLAGYVPTDPLQSPPEGRKPFLATPPPSSAQAPPEPPESISTPPSRVRLLTHAGRTQSIRAWANTLGIDRRTLAYRLNHGWRVDEALGFTPRGRDRAAEQARSLATRKNTRVLILDGERTVPRREAAQRLGIKPQSLTHRLRQYRSADGSTVRIPFSLLDRG